MLVTAATQDVRALFSCQNSGSFNLPQGRRLKVAALSLALTALLTLTACSKQETAAPSANAAIPSAAAVTTSSYDAAATKGKGFTAGALMSAQTVYVIFEPQCPHCGRLWQASLPLHSKVKFVWMPVSFNAKSLPQAAALITAPNPVETMTAHEESLLAGKGGISAPSNIAPDIEQAIKANGQLLTSLGADSVPFLVAKHRGTGEVVSFNGAMDTAALARLLGVE